MELEIDRFFGEIASIRMDISDYQNWCNEYQKFRNNYPAWTTKDGNKVHIYNMTDSHLSNTIAFVEKKDPEAIWLQILKQEQTYRKLLKKISSLKEELYVLEGICDKVF